jgi:hypothetical protein
MLLSLSNNQSKLGEYIMQGKLGFNNRQQDELTIPARYSFLRSIKRKWNLKLNSDNHSENN